MDARLEKQASIRSVLFIYRCLPTHLPTYLSTYLPAPVTGRSIPRTGAYVRLATQSNRIESDLSFLPSFLPLSTRCRGARPFSGCPNWPPIRRKVARTAVENPSRRLDSRPPDRERFSNRSKPNSTKIRNKRTSWRARAPRSPTDRSIDRSIRRAR